MEAASEEEEEENSFDMNDELSVTLSTEDSGGQEEDADDACASKAEKATRGTKRLKGGVQLSPSKCKANRGKRAGCWKYFKEITVQSKKEFGVMDTKAKCKFCILTFTAADGSVIVNPDEYDHEHTRLLIAKMIIAHEYSFRMVEHKWFNILMKWMNSKYEPIGRKTIRKECMKVYESEKEKLKKSLREAESISLTTDLWTSNQNVQYMCLVAHYIDSDWVSQCRVLNFVELDPPHTGIVIAQAIFDCLVEWKIEDKVMTMTLDNASNNDAAITNLKSKLLARRNPQFDPIYFHVRCSSHIVNLVVNDGLEPVDDLISSLRDTVKYFKRSPSRMYKFVEVCNDYAIKVGKGLSLDVKTRWNSTYKMLDTCIQYRAAFGYYAQVDHNYVWQPTESDWDKYDKIRPILGTMAAATTAFSGSVYPTANVFYPYIVKVKIALIAAKKSSDAYLRSMAAAMLEKFDKYWEVRNNVMVIATILDPRFKMRYIKWCFGQLHDSSRCQKECEEINIKLEELYKKYEVLYRQKNGEGSSSAHSASISKDTSSDLASIVPSEFQDCLDSSATESSKSELLIYLDEPNVSIEDKKFNLLNFWKVNSHKFPVVASMAKRFLAVPAGSVSSEATFSCGGRILDDYRSSLKPATVQALVCASSWIRGSQNPIIAGEADDEDDIESVEFPKCVVASSSESTIGCLSRVEDK
ncbi:hypothetical protein BS78_04G226700 [Paspalum vaginatum]|nr:hypothetical protein BS78_04G226700 [Paspalum vaginatum]